MIDEREEATGEECIPVEVGEEFWKVINRGEAVEPGRELGERIGLMEEDAGGGISSSGACITPFANGGDQSGPGPHTRRRRILMFGKKKKAKAKVELVSVETEEEFHAALDRGADVELTHELAEKVGLMVEDVGTLEDIKAARFDPYN